MPSTTCRIGLRSYKLATPLAPGATTQLTFDLATGAHGFTNTGAFTAVEYNGSFVNGQPAAAGHRLPAARRDHHRPRAQEVRAAAAASACATATIPRASPRTTSRTDADFITFEATVGTEADQIAIAPGYLQKEWTQDGRRYFEYKMDAPILNFFAFQSGRYAVKKDRWNDVAIEIYYQPGHEYNLDRMIAATKSGLDYFTANFGPYQHKQFRIIEFPRYAALRAVVPQHHPVFRGHRLHRARARRTTRTTSTIRTT